MGDAGACIALKSDGTGVVVLSDPEAARITDAPAREKTS